MASEVRVNWITDNLGISADLQGKIAASLVVLIVLLILRIVILRSIHQRVEDGEAAYRTTKLTSYSVTFIAIVTLSWIWLEAFENIATYLGLVSAGVAIALSDVLKNMAGWVYLLTRRPFKVGDRIEMSDIKGDVVDIRLFRFSLMEVGNWVDADQSTGRLIHVPNGNVFTTPIANYTEGFGFVWHELPFLVTFESDWRKAEEILVGALNDHAPKLDSRAESQIRSTARRYQIKIGAVTPIVYLTVKDSGVLLTGRFLVDARSRRSVEQMLWKSILDGIAAEPAVELAYPTVRTYFDGVVPLRHEGRSE